MQAIKEKNQKKPTLQTHSKTKDVASELGVNYSTLHRDIKYLEIEIIKDEDNVSWITNEEKDKLLGLRNHIKETGKRAGFAPEKAQENVIEENIIEETPETLEITMTQSTEPTTTKSTELATTESLELTNTESGGITNNNPKQSQINQEIYVEPEKPTNNVNLQELMRNASKLRAREAAMPALLTRAIADKMTEDDLLQDLKQKVHLAREAANPKFTPSEIADEILNQYRQGLIG